MKKALGLILAFLVYSSLLAQSDVNIEYSRSSLYTILLTHPKNQYSDDIWREYYSIGDSR